MNAQSYGYYKILLDINLSTKEINAPRSRNKMSNILSAAGPGHENSVGSPQKPGINAFHRKIR